MVFHIYINYVQFNLIEFTFLAVLFVVVIYNFTQIHYTKYIYIYIYIYIDISGRCGAVGHFCHFFFIDLRNMISTNLYTFMFTYIYIFVSGGLFLYIFMCGIVWFIKTKHCVVVLCTIRFGRDKIQGAEVGIDATENQVVGSSSVRAAVVAFHLRNERIGTVHGMVFHASEIVSALSAGMMMVVQGRLSGWRAVRRNGAVLRSRSTDIVAMHLSREGINI